MILNVGCGGSRRYPNKMRFYGDINVDIRKPEGVVPNFVLCDLFSLPFREKSFHVICLFEVIEHVGSPLNALREIKKLLVERGVLCLSTPNSYNILKVLQVIKRGFAVVDRGHIVAFGKFELYQLLKEAGFSKVEIGYVSLRGLPLKAKVIEKFFVRVCPFKALKGRQLLAYAMG